MEGLTLKNVAKVLNKKKVEVKETCWEDRTENKHRRWGSKGSAIMNQNYRTVGLKR